MPTVKPLDEEMILSSVKKTGRVITVEEHYVRGGLGTAVSDLLCEKHPAPVMKLGVPHDYATSGPYDEIMRKYGLDAPGIAAAAESFIRG